MRPRWIKSVRWAAMGLLLAACASPARAQSSSFYGDPEARAAAGQELTLSGVSWTYQAPTPRREIKLNDVLTAIVDYKSQVISEGQIDRKKKANFKAALSDWVLLKHWTLYPDPQSKGDPKVTGSWDNKFRGEGSLESRDAMTFKIACTVVDIRPNGVLVIEGRRSIQNNEETWDLSLTGSVRPQDVLTNNTVLSENIAGLRIYKREVGSVRDSYRRGWLMRWLDTYQMF
ncbi:MAG: flagellar basal body L-ring protein FlgH [Planctomycetia bacterium]|nr:flagellar basal body L-ring protein FlgH [Planctomycetia bacterium]